jgi:hypothetical protein
MDGPCFCCSMDQRINACCGHIDERRLGYRSHVAAGPRQQGPAPHPFAPVDCFERSNPRGRRQKSQLSVPIGDQLYPFARGSLSQLPCRKTVNHIPGAIDGLGQRKCGHHCATNLMAENGWLRVSRIANDRYFAFRPKFEPDKFEPLALAVIRNAIDNIGELREQTAPIIAVERNCFVQTFICDRCQLDIGGSSSAGGTEQTLRSVPVFAICAASVALELSRFTWDDCPVAKLVGREPPSQQLQTVADRGIDPVGADHEIGTY